MSAIATNQFIAVQSPVAYTAVATAANTDFDTPTQVVELIPPEDNIQGMRLTRIYAIARADPTSAVNCQLYRTIGTTHTLIDSILLPDVAASGTVANARAPFSPSEDDPLFLHPGEGLSFAIGVTVADGTVLGARSSLFTDTEPWSLYVGSPARQARALTEEERSYFRYSADNYVRLKDQHLMEGFSSN